MYLGINVQQDRLPLLIITSSSNNTPRNNTIMLRFATIVCLTILVVLQNHHSYAGRAPDQSPDLPDGVS